MDFTLSISNDNKLNSIDANLVYDLIIIGAGPAGLTSAVYAMRKMLNCAVITENIGGQVLDTYSLENYMGYRFIEGFELANKFHEQVKQFPIAVKEGFKVTSLRRDNNIFIVTLDNDAEYKAKSIIVSAGKKYRKLGVKGEKEFTGKGVAFCATCDAPLYRDKITAVVGGGNSGIEAALELAKIAKEVCVIQNIDKLTADQVLVDKLNKFDNVKVLFNTSVNEIFGDGIVTGIKVTESGVEKEINLDGIFIEIGLIPNTNFVNGFLRLNVYNEIEIDCGCRTSVPGIFAAGDITSVPEKQIIVAAGEGAKAALSAFKYISNI